MVYVCDICGFQYDEVIGDSATGIAPGTKLEDFPDNWRCPLCQAGVSHMISISENNEDTMSSGSKKGIPEKSVFGVKKTVVDYRDIAREKLMGNCSVNKTCDGDPDRICMGPKFGGIIGFGGAGQGKTFHANYLALDKYRIKMRLIKSHCEPDMTSSFLGVKTRIPVLVPSLSGVKNMNNAVLEEDFQKGLLDGAKLFGTVGMSGQTPTHAERHPGLEYASGGVLIFKPQSQEVLKKEFQQAANRGAIAVGVDLDGCGSVSWAQAGNPVYRKSEKELQELVSFTELPVIFKGIMSVEDAEAVVKSGASAMVVSNHGGRVMDYGQGVAEVLPEIVELFKKKITIIADGACRTGYDVFKYLALGADFAMIGRPIVRMSLAGGAEAVKTYLEYVSGELRQAMLMTGSDAVQQISRSMLISSAI